MIAALLAALVTLGAPPCQEATPHEWQVEYADGVTHDLYSASGEITLDLRPYRDWRMRTRPAGTEAWSPWSEWNEVEHYPGDINGDCAVGAVDFSRLRMHFGEQCP